MSIRRPMIAAVALARGSSGVPHADAASDPEQQMQVRRQQLDAVKTQLCNMQQGKKQEEAKAKAEESANHGEHEVCHQRRIVFCGRALSASLERIGAPS
jgi:hypothetical protein